MRLILSCLMVAALVLVSCAPAVTEEEKKALPGEEEEVATAVEEVVTEEWEAPPPGEEVTALTDALKELKVSYPELFHELLKLPELEEIDEKDDEAIENIAQLALDASYRTAFEFILSEGIKDKREYCTPLQALLWVAYDRELRSYSSLRPYSLTKLISDAWKNTTTSKNYTSEKWQNFEEVVDRLNSSRLVSIYMMDNIVYDYEEAHARPHRFAPPEDTFTRKKGICNEQARFALHCLLSNGYDYDDFEVNENAACTLGIDIDTWQGHDVCLFKEGNAFYAIDNGQLRGPFADLVAAVDSTACRVNIAPWKKYFFRDVNLNVTKVVRAEEAKHPTQETEGKNIIIIDGITDEWPSDVAMVSDPAGDVSSDAKDKRGVDLKAVRAFMNENYLYVAIQIYDVFETSLIRNYFVALDFDGDKQDEYHFGVRPNGCTWVFDHKKDKNNWNAEDTWDVLALGKQDTIEMMISRKEYRIPSDILIYCRVTDGVSTLDTTEWFKVP